MDDNGTVDERGVDLAEARAALRSTWPSLTAADVEDFPPNTHKEAFDLLKQRTNAKDEEIQVTLSEVFGLVPEKHDPAPARQPEPATRSADTGEAIDG